MADHFDDDVYDEEVAGPPRERAVWTPLILGAVVFLLGADLLLSGTIYLLRVRSGATAVGDFGFRSAVVLVIGGSPALLGAYLSWVGWRRLQARKEARAIPAPP